MSVKIIDAGNKNFISEIEGLTDLPDNGMLNKVVTGCGGTTVALKNEIPYVICVPFRALIINKMKWAIDNNIKICPVMGGIKDEDILNFTGNKYLVTYDSLERLCSLIDPSKFKILIDESHKLIDSGSFRGNAIRTVLKNYKKFNLFIFMTATPVKDKYQLPELRKIQKYSIKWQNITPVSIRYICLNKGINIANNVAVLAMKHLNNEINGNAHIFINSVTSIINTIKVLNHANLIMPENISIICADNEENQTKIKKELGKDYSINPVGVVSKINFYTSTAFEGADILDESGRSYVISDGNKDYSKIDILTTLPQILGRIRDSKHKFDITLMFTPNQYYSHTTEEEFEIVVKKNLSEAQEIVDRYNTTSNMQDKDVTLKGIKTNAYILQDGENLILNETAWYNEMHSFETLHRTYYVNTNEFLDSTFIHNETTYNYIKNDESFEVNPLNKMRLGKKSDFVKLCKEYCKITDLYSFVKIDIETKYPIIKEAVIKLGVERIKALEYRKANIEKDLLVTSVFKSNDVKIVKLLNLKVGDWESTAGMKVRLQQIYNELHISKTAKSTDIEEWYDIKPSKKRIDGVQVAGLKIIDCRIKIN